MCRNDVDHSEQFKMFFDAVETYIQLKESGQMTGISIFEAFNSFLADPDSFEFSETKNIRQYVQAYMSLATITHISNVEEMKADYQQYSFDKGHRVLLIAHSQGNLWGNEMYELFHTWQKNIFQWYLLGHLLTMLQVREDILL